MMLSRTKTFFRFGALPFRLGHVSPANVDTTKLNYLDGERCSTFLPGQRRISLVAPSSGVELGSLEESQNEDVCAAVISSKKAFALWSGVTGTERGRVLIKAATLIRERADDISETEVVDAGKTITEARADVAACAECLEYYGGLAQVLLGQHIPLTPSMFGYTAREPLGVCGGIGAWNFPFLNIAWKAAPALCCGNTMVYKPSPLTPLSSVMFAEIMTAAGLPPGALNIIQGGAATGEDICRHGDISKVSFTGSLSTGSKVMSLCAGRVKKITLELGGKSPLIIFDDADLQNAIKGAVHANFLAQGQVCSNAARVYVHTRLYKEFKQAMLAVMNKITVGDPMNPLTHMGPLISFEHLSKVLDHVKTARKEGVTILFGGERLLLSDPPSLAGGFYMSPCLSECDHDSFSIVKEEVFGPVMTLIPFSDEDDVIQRANDSIYGLCAGVYTRDVGRAHRVTSKLQAGTCYINTYNVSPVQFPFGGYKQSGLGRENSLAVLDMYTQMKGVYVECGNTPDPFPNWKL